MPQPDMDPEFQHLARFKLPRGFRGRSPVAVQVWWLVQAVLFRPSPQVCYGWRNFLLRAFGARIGKGVKIRPSAMITYPWKLGIGDFSWIGDQVDLYTLGEIEIGSNAVVSQKSYLCTASHDHVSKTFAIFARKIVVEDEAWIAADVFIGPGVCIGKGAVVAARSSVFSDLPAGMVCMGSPARPVRPRIPVP